MDQKDQLNEPEISAKWTRKINLMNQKDQLNELERSTK